MADLADFWFNPLGKLVIGVEGRSEEHTSELQSHHEFVCRLLLEKKRPRFPPQSRWRSLIFTTLVNISPRPSPHVAPCPKPSSKRCTSACGMRYCTRPMG